MENVNATRYVLVGDTGVWQLQRYIDGVWLAADDPNSTRVYAYDFATNGIAAKYVGQRHEG